MLSRDADAPGRATVPSRRAVHVLERNLMVYRRAPLVLFSGFFEPVLYLLALELGVSRLVHQVEGPGGRRSTT